MELIRQEFTDAKKRNKCYTGDIILVRMHYRISQKAIRVKYKKYMEKRL